MRRRTFGRGTGDEKNLVGLNFTLLRGWNEEEDGESIRGKIRKTALGSEKRAERSVERIRPSRPKAKGAEAGLTSTSRPAISTRSTADQFQSTQVLALLHLILPFLTKSLDQRLAFLLGFRRFKGGAEGFAGSTHLF